MCDVLKHYEHCHGNMYVCTLKPRFQALPNNRICKHLLCNIMFQCVGYMCPDSKLFQRRESLQTYTSQHYVPMCWSLVVFVSIR